MSKRNTATKQTQSKPAPVNIDEPIPYRLTDSSGAVQRPRRIHLDMTMREVMGADQSWDEGGWDLLLYAAIDFANDACDITGGIPHPNRQGRSDTEMGARDCILAVIALAQKALGMLDAEEAARVKGGAA